MNINIILTTNLMLGAVISTITAIYWAIYFEKKYNLTKRKSICIWIPLIFILFAVYCVAIKINSKYAFVIFCVLNFLAGIIVSKFHK